MFNRNINPIILIPGENNGILIVFVADPLGSWVVGARLEG